MKRLNKKDYERMFFFLDKLKEKEEKSPPGTFPYSHELYLVGEFPDIFDDSDRDNPKCPRRILNIVEKWRQQRK